MPVRRCFKPIRDTACQIHDDLRHERRAGTEPDSHLVDRPLTHSGRSGHCGRRIREIQDEARRSVRRCIHSRCGEAATSVQRDSRRWAPARSAYVKQSAGGTGYAGGACARAVQSIGLDVNDVARTANTRAQGLGERHADARNRNAIGGDSAFDADGGKGMSRIARKIVGEPAGQDISKLDDEGLGIGLRRDVGHRGRRLNGNHARAVIHARCNFPERCGLDSGSAGRQRCLGTKRHGRTEQQHGGVSIHFYFASTCRSTLRTSRCFSSESGSFTCCTITRSFCVIVRIVPSNSLSPARTM